MNQIGARVQALDQHIACVLHHVGVVAQTADQGVRADQTVEHVVGVVAGDHVGIVVARTIDRRQTGESEILHVEGQRMGDRTQNQIGALSGQFSNRVQGVVHHVDVVAQPTHQGVGTARAVKPVGGAVANDPVGANVARPVD